MLARLARLPPRLACGAKPLRAEWDATSLRRDHAMSPPPPADAARASGGGGGVTPMRWNSVHARTSSPRQTPRPSPRPASPRSGREEADDRLAARRLLGHRVHQLVALRRQLTARLRRRSRASSRSRRRAARRVIGCDLIKSSSTYGLPRSEPGRGSLYLRRYSTSEMCLGSEVSVSSRPAYRSAPPASSPSYR